MVSSSPAELASQLPWPLDGHAELKAELIAAYSNGRHYHNLQHLTEVLDRISLLDNKDPHLVLAAWFHDSVYAGRPDDEECSAQWAEHALTGTTIGGKPVEVAEVTRLVRLTITHSPAPADTRGAILCDADLGILAANPQRYHEYALAVRQEYAHIAEADFRAGRAAILTGFLAREHIFHTAYGRAVWDEAARTNITAELADLTRPARAHLTDIYPADTGPTG